MIVKEGNILGFEEVHVCCKSHYVKLKLIHTLSG